MPICANYISPIDFNLQTFVVLYFEYFLTGMTTSQRGWRCFPYLQFTSAQKAFLFFSINFPTNLVPIIRGSMRWKPRKLGWMSFYIFSHSIHFPSLFYSFSFFFTSLLNSSVATFQDIDAGLNVQNHLVVVVVVVQGPDGGLSFSLEPFPSSIARDADTGTSFPTTVHRRGWILTEAFPAKC